MKNGYIVQGPVADQTSEGVVVEWPNGRVIIPRRFIDNVVLDAAEKKKIEEKHAKKAAVVTPDEEVLEMDLGLPPDPHELFTEKRLSGSDTQVHKQPAPVVLPTVELGERQEIMPGLSGSLPVGWALDREQGAWIAEAPGVGESGGRARIAGMVFSETLGRRTQITLAKEEAERIFGSWEIVEEGRRELAFQEAYEIFGRGEHNGTELRVRQILAWTGDVVWLFSCAWPAEGDNARVIESCLQTLEFSTAEAQR
jgi:hypothetical protein